MGIENAFDSLSSELRAGVGCADITADAPEYPVRDRLQAKALVFEDGLTRLAIITMDAVAIGGICDISDEFLPQLRTRIESELEIPADHVLVNASHTHPPGRILCSHEELVERTFMALSQAVHSLTAVRVGAGAGHENQIIMNRNIRLKNGRHWTIRHANPCPPDSEVEGVGPVDPEIGILRVDRLDGRPLAVVYNFGCHLLFGDTKGSITANFPGIASKIVEECLGQGVMAFFLQGTGGDVIDTEFKDFGRSRDIEPFGMKLGLNVLRTAQGIRTREGDLGVISECVELPRRRDLPARSARLKDEQAKLLESLRFTSLNFKSFLHLYLQHSLDPEYPTADSWVYLQAESAGNSQRAEMDDFNQALVEKYLANIHSMEQLARIQDELATFSRHEEINRESGSDTITAEVVGLRIGEFVLISAPIEILTEVGLNIKNASPFPFTNIAAFSNGYMHYGPTADAYDKGGYEVTECFLAPEWQKLYEQTVSDILQRLLAGSDKTKASEQALMTSSLV